MKRFLFPLLFLLSFQLFGQRLDERIAEDRYAGAAERHVYVMGDLKDTPAPCGYEPFYIGYIGRHGSRFHTTKSTESLAKLVKKFESYSKKGILTDDGMELLNGLRKFEAAHAGHAGELSKLGEQELSAIARRMYTRFPSVFDGATRMRSINTGSGRVIASQNSFLSALSALDTDATCDIINASEDTCYREWVKGLHLPSGGKDKVKAMAKSVADEALKSKLDPEAFCARVFKAGRVPSSPDRLMYSVRSAVEIGPCLSEDVDLPDLLEYFTDKDLVAMYYRHNLYNFIYMGNCRETYFLYPEYVGRVIMKHMIQDALDALEGSGRSLDLRFSHDVYVQPLLSFIGGEGNLPFSMSCKYPEWDAGMSMCMAMNVQMILYHNHKGDVLVKILHNEKEIALPALKAVKGPYYKWGDFVRHYMSK